MRVSAGLFAIVILFGPSAVNSYNFLPYPPPTLYPHVEFRKQPDLKTFEDCPAITGSARVTIILVQQSSPFLVEWILWHFTFADKLVVIEHQNQHGERSDYVDGVLAYAANNLNVDVRVVRDHFANKHRLLTAAMLDYKASSDVLVPMDHDEFLVPCKFELVARGTPGDNGWLMHNLKQGTRFTFGNVGLVSSGHGHMLIPRSAHTMALNAKYSKQFYNASTFISTDQGNHFGSVQGDQPSEKKRTCTTELCLLHFSPCGQSFWEKIWRMYHTYYELENRTHLPCIHPGATYCEIWRSRNNTVTRRSHECPSDNPSSFDFFALVQKHANATVGEVGLKNMRSQQPIHKSLLGARPPTRPIARRPAAA